MPIWGCVRGSVVLVDCGCVCAGVNSRNMKQRYNGRKHDGLYLYQASQVKVQQRELGGLKNKVQFSGRNRVRVWVHETSEQNVPKLAEENLQKLRIPRQYRCAKFFLAQAPIHRKRWVVFFIFGGLPPHAEPTTAAVVIIAAGGVLGFGNTCVLPIHRHNHRMTTSELLYPIIESWIRSL